MRFSKTGRALLCVLLSLMTCFTCVGYAAVSDELTIGGHAEYYLPPIYIAAVSKYSGNGTLESETHETETLLRSTVSLTAATSSTVVLAVTVKNRSQSVYGYNATIAGTDATSYSNPNITYGVFSDAACKTRLAQKTALHPESTATGANGLTFYVKFSYASGYKPSAAEKLSSYLHFNFKTPIDSIIEDAAVDNAIDQFHDILNDHIGDIDYGDLIDAMNDLGTDPDRNISYIGNVAGAPANDIAAINELFDGQLSININGEEQEVKFILKRENIDGNTATGGPAIRYTDMNGQQNVSGVEMVMYMTTETLERDSFWGSTYKTVYAIVYTSYDGGVTWEQLGEMYKGEASVVRYDGWMGDGSFSTDTWRSTEKYYGLSTRQSIETLISKIPKN